MGTASDWFGRRRILAALFLAAPFLCFGFLNSSGWLVFVYLVPLGFVTISPQPVMLAVVQDSFSENRALANGIFLMANFVIRSPALWLLGGLADRYGLSTAFLISAVLALATAPAVFWLPQAPTGKNRARKESKKKLPEAGQKDEQPRDHTAHCRYQDGSGGGILGGLGQGMEGGRGEIDDSLDGGVKKLKRYDHSDERGDDSPLDAADAQDESGDDCERGNSDVNAEIGLAAHSMEQAGEREGKTLAKVSGAGGRLHVSVLRADPGRKVFACQSGEDSRLLAPHGRTALL